MLPFKRGARSRGRLCSLRVRLTPNLPFGEYYGVPLVLVGVMESHFSAENVFRAMAFFVIYVNICDKNAFMADVE